VGERDSVLLDAVGSAGKRVGNQSELAVYTNAMETSKCFVVPPSEYKDAIAAAVSRLLNLALAYNGDEAELSDIEDSIRRGESVLLVRVADGVICAALTVRLVQYPRLRALHLDYGAGVGIRQMDDLIKDVARAAGCSRIETCCRERVAKAFARYGFDTSRVMPVFYLGDDDERRRRIE